MVGKLELLDDLERGKIDRCRGPQVRRRVEERARKYESWARPRQPLAVPEPAAIAPTFYDKPHNLASCLELLMNIRSRQDRSAKPVTMLLLLAGADSTRLVVSHNFKSEATKACWFGLPSVGLS